MKILVTGGSGLVGTAIKSLKNQYPQHIFYFVSSKDYDLRDIKQVNAMFVKFLPNVVVHLAAKVGGLYKNMLDKVEMFEENVLINFNVLKYAYMYGVDKCISCLSTCIFPDKVVYPIDEKSLHDGAPHNSNYAYAYAKRMLDIHSRVYRENFGKNFMCVIPTNIYGEYDNFNLNDSHVIPGLVHKCYLAKKMNKKFVVRGSGLPLRQFIYSKDLARLLLKIIEDNREIDNLILSTDEKAETAIMNVAGIIADKIGYSDEIVYDDNYSDGQYKKTVSNKKLRELYPNFVFTNLEKGIENTVKWFNENYEKARK